jgi:hypothetical protein
MAGLVNEYLSEYESLKKTRLSTKLLGPQHVIT